MPHLHGNHARCDTGQWRPRAGEGSGKREERRRGENKERTEQCLQTVRLFVSFGAVPAMRPYSPTLFSPSPSAALCTCGEGRGQSAAAGEKRSRLVLKRRHSPTSGSRPRAADAPWKTLAKQGRKRERERERERRGEGERAREGAREGARERERRYSCPSSRSRLETLTTTLRARPGSAVPAAACLWQGLPGAVPPGQARVPAVPRPHEPQEAQRLQNRTCTHTHTHTHRQPRLAVRPRCTVPGAWQALRTTSFRQLFIAMRVSLARVVFICAATRPCSPPPVRHASRLRPGPLPPEDSLDCRPPPGLLHLPRPWLLGNRGDGGKKQPRGRVRLCARECRALLPDPCLVVVHHRVRTPFTRAERLESPVSQCRFSCHSPRSPAPARAALCGSSGETSRHTLT